MKTEKSWSSIAPTWPLQNIIACNPLQGLEVLKFDEALKKAAVYFECKDFPEELEEINRLTIKWCQVYFDRGQATIKMPNRDQGLYAAWSELAIFDDQLHKNLATNKAKLRALPKDAKDAIAHCLSELKIAQENESEFLTLLLTSLAGWAAYVKYLGEWSYQKNPEVLNDYLALRLALALIIWPEAKNWQRKLEPANDEKLAEILNNEQTYREPLLQQILDQANENNEKKSADAQLVFCIDVRSEPFRRALEAQGNYETFGFAGFFGIPAVIENNLNNQSYPSCPVLLKPKHTVCEVPVCPDEIEQKHLTGRLKLALFKKVYQSLKYNFTTPLALAEGIGLYSGCWMLLRALFPRFASFLRKKIINFYQPQIETSPEVDPILFKDRANYALGALKTMGLTDNFAPIVVFCGHGSTTENNTYATALDCGACGGRHGGSNAKILAKILNQKEVRQYLKQTGIAIPDATKFIAAEHDTTTDEVFIYLEGHKESEKVIQLKLDLSNAAKANRSWRAKQLGDKKKNCEAFINKRSINWAETQPEWGLARNAAFIVAPRSLTQKINLEGRCFLHSYDYTCDEDNAPLNLILNAPMVVAQWINSQYLFSTLNNAAYGAGSKLTMNVVGKIGVMQGNGSDLMHGLPLQSVWLNYREKYHLPARLMTLVYAPLKKIEEVIFKSPKLQELFTNDWVALYCLDPSNHSLSCFNSDQTWNQVKFDNVQRHQQKTL